MDYTFFLLIIFSPFSARRGKTPSSINDINIRRKKIIVVDHIIIGESHPIGFQV
jgi:hypothetical protein